MTNDGLPPPKGHVHLMVRTVTIMAKSKIETIDGDQTLMTGLSSHFQPKTSLLLVGKTWKIGDVIKQLKARSAARSKTTAAKTTYSACVASEEQLETEISPIRRALLRFLQGRFGDDSVKLADFGFAPSKRKKPSAQTKATAVVQRKATREARGTKGKNQKKGIKGVVPADGGVAINATTSQTAASTTSSAATKPVNAPGATNGTAAS